jgi:hypothetical protein
MMGYYQGDFYGGARGDPFFGALLGLGKSLIGKLSGLGGGKLLGGGGGGMPGGSVGGRMAPMLERGGKLILKHPVLSGAGAAGAISVAGRALGGPSAAHKRYMKKLKWGTDEGRRRKRMNVCNPRALRRAIRRTHGFARLAMKTIHLVHPKKKARFGGFKKKRKH